MDATLSVEITGNLQTWTANDVMVVTNAPDLLIASDEDPLRMYLRRFMKDDAAASLAGAPHLPDNAPDLDDPSGGDLRGG